MTTHPPDSNDPLRFNARQYGAFVAIAFGIWLTGVAAVRLLPDAAFDPDEAWPILLFAVSIGLGIGTQLVVPFLVRLPFRETLVPVMALCGSALMMDGLAIAFSDIYTSNADKKVVVGGWLLWTFGTQIVISIAMIGRHHRTQD